MPYRETVRTRANAHLRRTRIERAARHVIARGGFAAASVAAVAREAECSAGLIYTYYVNRDELLRAVFERAADHELHAVELAIDEESTRAGVASSVVEVFISRAVAGRRLAHAMLLEEVPEAVQLQRLALRRSYVSAIAARLDGVGAEPRPGRSGPERPLGSELHSKPCRSSGPERSSAPVVPSEVIARSLVGGIAENLVDVLDPNVPPPSLREVEGLIAALSAYSRSALGDQ